jgi:hypothetical protein
MVSVQKLQCRREHYKKLYVCHRVVEAAGISAAQGNAFNHPKPAQGRCNHWTGSYLAHESWMRDM